MDWRSAQFDWNQARAVLATAEEGSLSAAARALGTTQPTLGRQVSAFEEALGLVVFERTGKSLILTPGGAELVNHLREMRDAADRVSLSASGQSQSVEGVVRISASDVFSTVLLPPIVADIRRKAPALGIEIVADNALSDLQRREADIALRHVRPVEPQLIARRVCEMTARIYAAPQYFSRQGTPQTKSALAAHQFVHFGSPDELVTALTTFGVKLTSKQFFVGSENGAVAWEMVRQGLGIGIMADAVAQATGGVQVVLPDEPPILFPVWLTTHRELHTAKRIRLVYDLLAEAFARPFNVGGGDREVV